MKADVNYPRMMFHPRKDPVTVYSEEQEAALGREWSRRMFASLPREEKPSKVVYPEPEDEPEPEPEPEEPEEPVEEPAAAEAAPPVKPKRGRPAAHKPLHPPLHKRKH